MVPGSAEEYRYISRSGTVIARLGLRSDLANERVIIVFSSHAMTPVFTTLSSVMDLVILRTYV